MELTWRWQVSHFWWLFWGTLNLYQLASWVAWKTAIYSNISDSWLLPKYVTRDFRVTIMLADNQFEPMCGNLADMHAQLHIIAWDENVLEIEKYNSTEKEFVCGNYNIIPFNHLPPIVFIEMVYTAVFWRKIFALKGGVFRTQRPFEIILNYKSNFNAHRKTGFGEYVQTHKEHDNTM